MTPFFAVLRVVNVAPQLQVAVVSTYSGWMSGFAVVLLTVGRSPGRRRLGRRDVNRNQRVILPEAGPPVTTPGRAGLFPLLWVVPPSVVVSAAVAVAVARHRHRLLDLHEELGVALGLLHPVQQQLEGLLGLQGVQHPAELPGDLELVLGHQDLFLAGAGRVDVHRGEDALVRQLAVELELHVAGALELLEDNLVHPGAGLDQRGGEDRQRAAVLDVAGGTEEALRRVERRRVDTTGEDPAAGGGSEVVGTAEAGDGVEQHDHAVAELDQPLGPLDGQLGPDGVGLGRPVEGRGDDLALHRALHVGDLLGPLVDEHDHEVDLGVVHGDRVGDRLQHHRLARLGGRDDQAALTLAQRGDQVDNAGGEDAGLGLEAKPVLRVERRQLAELDPVARLVGVGAVDRVQPDQRVELLLALALLLLPDRAGDGVALAQAALAYLGERHVHVVGARQVAGGPDEGVVLEDVEDAGNGHQDVVLADLGQRLVLVRREAVPATATVPVAVPVAAAPAAAAAAAVEVVVVAGALVALAAL